VALGPNATVTASNSVALGAGSVADRANSVSVGSSGAERQITNVAAGTAPTDAVNLGQLLSLSKQFDNQQSQITALSDRLALVQAQTLKNMNLANSGIAGAMAMATLPQAYTPGKGMIAGGLGSWQGQAALAFGASKAMDDGRTVFKASASFTRYGAGGAVAVGWQF
jgi:autotransporter adhesin